VLAEVTAREIGRVTIAEALELTALVARKQPECYGRFAARWLCLFLEEHEKATLDEVTLLVSNLRSLATPKDHGSALAIFEEGRTATLRTVRTRFTWIGRYESEPEGGHFFRSEPEGWQRAGPCARDDPESACRLASHGPASSPEPGCGGR
jgi:hypothetical protein